MGQSCNHVAAAMYRIEAAVRNGLTNPFCTSAANQWLPNHKDVKTTICVDTKEKYNPLSEQGDMKKLTLNDFAESVRDVCPESILFSAVPKPDVDFVADLLKQQSDEVPENLCSVYEWISKSANVEDFLQTYLSTCQKKKYQKLNY